MEEGKMCFHLPELFKRKVGAEGGRVPPLPRLSHNMAVNSRDSINLVRLLKRLENPETPAPALVRAEVAIYLRSTRATSLNNVPP